MKLSHLSVLVVICASMPSVASAITINNATELAAALKTATGGEVFDLAPGNYGALSLNNRSFSSAVTFRSIDPAKPAVFGQTKIENTSNLKFSNVSFSNPLAPGVPDYAATVTMFGTKNVSFSNVRVYGSMDGNSANDGVGFLIRNSSNVAVTGSQFTQLNRGAGFAESSGITFTGNSMYDIRSDGLNFSGVQNVSISGNTFQDFTPLPGDHADAIQFWTVGSKSLINNVTISNNLIVGKINPLVPGAQMQGIFMGDNSGGSMPLSNITIQNNTLVGTNWHGITVTDASGLLVTDNILVTLPDSTVTATRISLTRVSGVLSDNAARIYIVNSSPNLQQSGNTTNAVSASLAEAAIKAWYDANQPSLPVTDTTPITSTDDAFTEPLPTPDGPVPLNTTDYLVTPITDDGTPLTGQNAFGPADQVKKNNRGQNKKSAGTVLSAVPEPATWAQLVVGFGLVGWLIRQNRSCNRASLG